MAAQNAHCKTNERSWCLASETKQDEKMFLQNEKQVVCIKETKAKVDCSRQRKVFPNAKGQPFV